MVGGPEKTFSVGICIMPIIKLSHFGVVGCWLGPKKKFPVQIYVKPNLVFSFWVGGWSPETRMLRSIVSHCT